MGAAGISVNRQGTLALVSNLVDGTVSVFTIQGKTVSPAGTVEVGGKAAGGGMVAITPDGKTALVSRSNDNKISETPRAAQWVALAGRTAAARRAWVSRVSSIGRTGRCCGSGRPPLVAGARSARV